MECSQLVPYANPEDHKVFALSTKLADEIGAKVCIANDPDADRTGLALKRGKWENGSILMETKLESFLWIIF